jgi:hypothetical protein
MHGTDEAPGAAVHPGMRALRTVAAEVRPGEATATRSRLEGRESDLEVSFLPTQETRWLERGFSRSLKPAFQGQI